MPVVEGFTTIHSFATHSSGRFVISGERNGQEGLWLADPGRPVRRIAAERLIDPALAPDGRRIVVIRDSHSGLPWIGAMSTVLVLPVR
ncbi:hypothetical protein [Dactylosporangium sp. NPDC048998]|uniref:hypothetical protein n=1 Tax=Dactylosporangium sp. NPDC048998 TaxID=3363976 RepID=UPI00371E1DFF